MSQRASLDQRLSDMVGTVLAISAVLAFPTNNRLEPTDANGICRSI